MVQGKRRLRAERLLRREFSHAAQVPHRHSRGFDLKCNVPLTDAAWYVVGADIDRGDGKHDLTHGFGRRGDGRPGPDRIGCHDRACSGRNALRRHAIAVLLRIRWPVVLPSTRLPHAGFQQDARGPGRRRVGLRCDGWKSERSVMEFSEPSRRLVRRPGSMQSSECAKDLPPHRLPHLGPLSL
jgi:hypothetical protein